MSRIKFPIVFRPNSRNYVYPDTETLFSSVEPKDGFLHADYTGLHTFPPGDPLTTVPIRIITRIAFKERLKIWYADYRKAKIDDDPITGTDAVNFNGKVGDAVDFYLDLFADSPSMDLDNPSIVVNVNDFVLNVKESVTESTISASVLLADGTEEERYS